jgi:hypothetical protein
MMIVAIKVVSQFSVDSNSPEVGASNSLAALGFGTAIISYLLSYVHYPVIVLENMGLEEYLRKGK